MKIKYLSSAEKYASAFVPPKVSCRTLRRCFSEGRASGLEVLSPSPTACVWPAIHAEPLNSRAKINGSAARDLGITLFDLLSLFEFHRRGDWLAVSHHFHVNHV